MSNTIGDNHRSRSIGRIEEAKNRRRTRRYGATGIPTESALWLALGLTVFIFRTGSAFLNLGCAIFCTLHPPATNPTLWRLPKDPDRSNTQGLIMSTILPTVLLHTASLCDDRWIVYAQATLPISLFSLSTLVPLHIVGAILGKDIFILEPKAGVFLLARLLIFHSLKIYRSMQGVFTYGEWTVVVCIIGIALSETVFLEETNLQITHQLVAATGTVGCLIGCALAAKIPSVAIRIPLLITTPLATVEAAMHWNHFNFDFPFPKSVNWLLYFLTEDVSDVWPGLPRLFWVVYWFAILLVMLPISILPFFHKLAPPVVTRKWFHLIAVLLFTPVTLFCPELMLLVYAIALCVLMVIECVRPGLPKAVQKFYGNFVDHEKDQSSRVIISHMALVAGCAFPMWLSACTKKESKLLQLWGVLVLGVGDSLGAVVGKAFGKIKWGRNRTIEGSLAMLISLGVSCSFFGDFWLLAVLFTTLLEAFTCQIDNIVLPISGAVILMLF